MVTGKREGAIPNVLGLRPSVVKKTSRFLKGFQASMKDFCRTVLENRLKKPKLEILAKGNSSIGPFPGMNRKGRHHIPS